MERQDGKQIPPMDFIPAAVTYNQCHLSINQGLGKPGYSVPANDMSAMPL